MRGIIIDTESGDIKVKNGTMALGENQSQCVEQILVSNRGEYKEHPLVGGEVIKMLHGEPSRFWAGRAKNMCKAMGITVRNISVNGNGKIRIEQ